MFSGLKVGSYGTILADPPWRFEQWSKLQWHERSDRAASRAAERFYHTLPIDELCALPVRELALPDAVLFLWATWPHLQDAFRVIEAWGFTYKTCGFAWAKARSQLDLFRDGNIDDQMGLGY